jgi:hypothetical protein
VMYPRLLINLQSSLARSISLHFWQLSGQRCS